MWKIKNIIKLERQGAIQGQDIIQGAKEVLRIADVI